MASNDLDTTASTTSMTIDLEGFQVSPELPNDQILNDQQDEDDDIAATDDVFRDEDLPCDPVIMVKGGCVVEEYGASLDDDDNDTLDDSISPASSNSPKGFSFRTKKGHDVSSIMRPSTNKRGLVGSCSMLMCVIMAGVAVAFLVAGWIFIVSAHKDGKSGSTADISGSEIDETPTPAPSIQEPLLRSKDDFSHYIVQWGLQTLGCGSLTWPTLELSCADPRAVVHVLDHALSDTGSPQAKDASTMSPIVNCQRDTDNLVRCHLTDFSVAEVDSAAAKSPLFGELLVVCAVGDDDNMNVTLPKTQTGKKSMELIANIPIGAYAQDCNLLLSEEEMQTGSQVLERHGGHAMPWLAMGRVCRRNDNDNSDPSRQRFLRQLDADDTDKLFDVQADRFLCGQGHRTTVNDQQAYCFHQNNCASLEVCNGPNGCTGAPSCDIASETVRAEMIDLVGNDGSDSGDDDEDPDCIFERILPYDRMWDLAASQMDQKPPSLDTPEVPGQP